MLVLRHYTSVCVMKLDPTLRLSRADQHLSFLILMHRPYSRLTFSPLYRPVPPTLDSPFYRPLAPALDSHSQRPQTASTTTAITPLPLNQSPTHKTMTLI